MQESVKCFLFDLNATDKLLDKKTVCMYERSSGIKPLETTEVRMLRWKTGVSLKDQVRNEKKRAELGVTRIRDEGKEARLR